MYHFFYLILSIIILIFIFFFYYFIGQLGIRSLECDWLNGHLYWTSVKAQKVYVGRSDGNGAAAVVAKDGTPLDLVLLPTER